MNENDATDAQQGSSPRPRSMSKTPMFTAIHAVRYGRQQLIREIDDVENTALICYVTGAEAEIERDDTLGFVDLLHNIQPGTAVDLLLHTGGGQVDACEKIINLLQAHVEQGKLRVVVPEMAKSAGTILSLIADEILMSSTSELGMIDPQFALKDNQGNPLTHSVVRYLHAFRSYSGRLSGGVRDTLAERMLLDFDAKVVAKFEGIEKRIRILGEGLLKRKQNPRYTAIIKELLSSEKWHTHGQPISSGDAFDLGLPIIYLPITDPSWQRYWSLYCLQRREVALDGKLFESAFVSQLVRPDSDGDT